MRIFFGILGSIISISSIQAQQEVQHQEPPPRGIYLGMSSGHLYFLNSFDRQVFGDAWLVGIKAGYDFNRFISLEGQLRFSAHDTSISVDATNPSGIPTSFVAFQAQALAKGFYPLTRRFSLTAELGGGTWYTDPNQKATVRGPARLMASAGLGLQYFLRIRGLAMGLDPQISVIQDLEGPVLQVGGYLRYTF